MRPSLLLIWVLLATPLRAANLPIDLDIDATQAPSRVIHSHMTMSASAGKLTLLYPRWTTGEHFASGVVTQLSNLYIRVNGRALSWRRDSTAMDAFHVHIPETGRLEIDFDYLLPEPGTARANSSARLLMLRWNTVLLYPDGVPVSRLFYHARLRLPADWHYSTALEIEGPSTFAPVRLDTLVDSPVLAGLHLRTIPLQSPGNPPHFIAIAADSAPALEMSAASIANAGELITQARKLFGRFHFPSYRFLVAASDYTAGGGGIEHGASSDDRVPEAFYHNAAVERSRFNLYSHEYVHSWDGKFRIPLGHLTSDFQTPLRSDLLWVYEGLTSYLGNLLGARSGACTPEYFREHLAALVAGANTRTGRRWRPLQDTLDATSATMDAGFSVPTGWDSRHRTLDFYDEGPLIWLEVDTLLRRESHGARSLDDFAKDFFGVEGVFPDVRSYVADDVYRALDRVVKHNWRALFEERLTSLAETAPTRGLIDSGWRLVFNEVPNQYLSDVVARLGGIDERFTLGLVITSDGAVVDVIDGGPAARAGLFPGQRIRSIDGRPYNANLLHEVAAARRPIRVVTTFAGFEQSHELQYTGGLQFPHLERLTGTPDLLSAIVSPQ